MLGNQYIYVKNFIQRISEAKGLILASTNDDHFYTRRTTTQSTERNVTVSYILFLAPQFPLPWVSRQGTTPVC
jgi:hypothetical protein